MLWFIAVMMTLTTSVSATIDICSSKYAWLRPEHNEPHYVSAVVSTATQKLNENQRARLESIVAFMIAKWNTHYLEARETEDSPKAPEEKLFPDFPGKPLKIVARKSIKTSHFRERPENYVVSIPYPAFSEDLSIREILDVPTPPLARQALIRNRMGRLTKQLADELLDPAYSAPLRTKKVRLTLAREMGSLPTPKPDRKLAARSSDPDLYQLCKWVEQETGTNFTLELTMALRKAEEINPPLALQTIKAISDPDPETPPAPKGEATKRRTFEEIAKSLTRRFELTSKIPTRNVDVETEDDFLQNSEVAVLRARASKAAKGTKEDREQFLSHFPNPAFQEAIKKKFKFPE